MHIVEFSNGTLRFLDKLPAAAPTSGFVWIYLEREELQDQIESLQRAAHSLGGSALLELHVRDLANRAHPSHYDFTSVYDLVIFRRLATDQEVRAEHAATQTPEPDGELAAFGRIRTRAVAFAVFDRLLVTVHPAGCFTAQSFIERYLSDAVHSEGQAVSVRSRLPTGPADLMLRMINLMVDSYLDLRRALGAELDQWQQKLLAPRSHKANWAALMTARGSLHTLEDLCEEQNDAIQEWLDTQMEQPSSPLPQIDREAMLARARDISEHIQRVVHHVRAMEHAAETAVQIHFSALSHRTNEIMRVLTALTAVFLPLNFITGFFGMNFEFLPLIHSSGAMWIILAVMVAVALGIVMVFWRKRYLVRTGR